MIRFVTYVLMTSFGIYLIDDNTWQNFWGGFLIFMAGTIAGEDRAKSKNKLSDHLRKETEK